MVKEAAKFTREQPCTKVDIWNAFCDTGARLKRVPAVLAKREIGDNAPKYLLRKGFIRFYQAGDVDYYEFTAQGDMWLRKGLIRHLELHPEDKKLVKNSPTASTTKVVRRR